MFKQKSATLKTTLLFTVVVNLSGCVTALKHLDIGASQSSSPTTDQAISIDQLLSQARSQKPSGNAEHLYMRFEPQRFSLNPDQQDNLLNFAQKSGPKSQTVLLECALSQHNDPFIAASIAIKRCNAISTFLGNHAFHSDTALAPDLQPDQVRVHRLLMAAK